MEAYDPKSEYDAFGPWIYELSDIKQLPPIFSLRYREKNDFLMLIKIPRNIERRDAAQGMVLYDYVIGLYENDVYLLECRGYSVIESRIPYNKIEMIEDYRNLLFGKLTILTTGEKTEIFYNTVSGDIITRAIKIMRGKYATKSYKPVKDYFYRKPETEILYSNMLVSMESDGDAFDVSAAQPAMAATALNQSPMQKLLNILFKKQLLPSLHLLNSRELLVISRGKPFKQPDAVYSYALNYIPIEKIGDVELVNCDVYSNLKTLHIRLEGYTQTYYLGSSNISAQEYYRNLRNLLPFRT